MRIILRLSLVAVELLSLVIGIPHLAQARPQGTPTFNYDVAFSAIRIRNTRSRAQDTLWIKTVINSRDMAKRKPEDRQHHVGDLLLVKLSGGRIVEAEVKAIVDTTDGIRLQVSFGEETALVYLWQVVKNPGKN